MGEKYLVAYELVIMIDKALGRGGALGSMCGDPSAFKRAMKSGGAELAYTVDDRVNIRITDLEGNRACFSALDRIKGF